MPCSWIRASARKGVANAQHSQVSSVFRLQSSGGCDAGCGAQQFAEDAFGCGLLQQEELAAARDCLETVPSPGRRACSSRPRHPPQCSHQQQAQGCCSEDRVEETAEHWSTPDFWPLGADFDEGHKCWSLFFPALYPRRCFQDKRNWFRQPKPAILWGPTIPWVIPTRGQPFSPLTRPIPSAFCRRISQLRCIS